MTGMRVTQEHLDTIIERAKAMRLRKVILFGGALEHPDDTEDIDIAVATEEGGNFVAFAVDLEQAMPRGVWVDVVPIQPNTPFIDYIERRGRVLYAAA
jgi:predicted nucleotidyltransferase